MLAKIRRMRMREGMSIREVAKRTGLSRNTVRQWLRQEGVTEPKYQARPPRSRVDGWGEYLAAALKADAHRGRRERRTVKALYEQIRSLGYGGSYVRVVVWVRRWRAQRDEAPRRAAFVPLAFAPGEAFQFDWSCEYAVNVAANFPRSVEVNFPTRWCSGDQPRSDRCASLGGRPRRFGGSG